jgi:hypothetical protein
MDGESGKVIMGVNLSWYPPPARKFIVEYIRRVYKPMYEAAMKNNPQQANEQRFVEMNLYSLKTMLDQYGFSFAIRQYIPGNIIKPKVCICYEDWDKAIKLDQPRIFPELQVNTPGNSLGDIHYHFKNYIQYQRNNKDKIKFKRDEAQKKLKYRFDN